MQVDKCFGFDTAVEEAQRALLAAKVEASSGYKGLGIVKLMGRSSGFIAMQASMASGERHCCWLCHLLCFLFLLQVAAWCLPAC
jgi:6-phosphofructokinase 1